MDERTGRADQNPVPADTDRVGLTGAVMIDSAGAVQLMRTTTAVSNSIGHPPHLENPEYIDTACRRILMLSVVGDSVEDCIRHWAASECELRAVRWVGPQTR